MPFVVFCLLAALLTQAQVLPSANAASSAPTPPSEKALAMYGRWETEYWSDTGGLSYTYVGDPTPASGQAGAPDFNISARSLLTAIIDVHVNPNPGDAQGTALTSVGSLSLKIIVMLN